MNLTDIQVELRNIQENILRLNTEIEKMKPKSEDTRKKNFENITKIAEKYPISGLKISEAGELLKKDFIASLSYLILMEETDIYSRLLYLCRISMGCGLKLTAEEIYKIGLEFNIEDMEKLCGELKKYKYNYLIEALILANLTGTFPPEMLSVIADMAKIMSCDSEEIKVLAQVSKSKLTDNLDLLNDIPVPMENRWSGKLWDYIPKEWIVGKRQNCATICVEKNIISPYEGLPAKKSIHVKTKPETGTFVRRGDVILVYDEDAESPGIGNSLYLGIISKIKNTNNKSFLTNPKEEKTEKTVTAPCDGILYFVEVNKESEINDKNVQDKYLEAYIVSYFDDYTDFCQWHKTQNTKSE